MAQKDLTFAAALALFTTATADSMKYAEICAMMALRHFAEHGNLVYCQRFMDAMPKNYIRKVAFVKWLANFAPVTMEKDKLLKDTSEGAKEFDLDGAAKEKFWEFAPDTEAVAFGPDDVLAAIKALIKKFENPKRSTPKDDLASAAVVSLKNYVETKAPKAPGNVAGEDVVLAKAVTDALAEHDAEQNDAEAEATAQAVVNGLEADLASTETMIDEGSPVINDLGGVQELAPVDQAGVETVADQVAATA